MSIRFIGITGTGGNTATSSGVGIPAGYTAGDILILSTLGGTAFNTPSEYIQLVSTIPGMQLWYKFASASESSLVLTGGSSNAYVNLAAYRGVASISPVSSVSVTASTTTASTQSITTTRANSWIVSLIGIPNISSGTMTVPSGVTNRNNPGSGPLFFAQQWNDEEQVAIGSTTVRTSTLSATTTGYSLSFALLSPRSLLTGFKTTDSNTNTTQDLGSRYITKDYLLDVYPNIASATGNRTAPGLWTWGGGGTGSNGLNNNGYYSSPVQVGALVNWKQISSADSAVLSIKTDGTLWAWGWNGNGRLGLNTTTNTYSSPVQVGALTNWKSLANPAVWNSGMMAITTTGALWGWGFNASGQLGNGNTTSYSSPIQIGALTDWKQVSMSQDHVLSVKTDGTLWAWGNNTYGQLGNNNRTFYSSPIQIGALTTWKQVAAGSDGFVPNFQFSAAIKTDGTLWVWGLNNRGQLGLGNTAYYSSPVQVGTLTNWKYVSCSSHNMYAIKTDGTLWAWGGNASGQLGQGYVSATVYYSSPIQVGALTNWKFISSNSALTNGEGSILAIKTDGTLWAWGKNQLGQLGVGNRSNYSSPVQVGALTTWKSAVIHSFGAAAIQDGYI